MNFYPVSVYDEEIINTVLAVFDKYPNTYFSVGNVLRNIHRLNLISDELHYNQVKWILQKQHSKGVMTRKKIRKKYVYKIRK